MLSDIELIENDWEKVKTNPNRYKKGNWLLTTFSGDIISLNTERILRNDFNSTFYYRGTCSNFNEFTYIKKLLRIK